MEVPTREPEQIGWAVVDERGTARMEISYAAHVYPEYVEYFMLPVGGISIAHRQGVFST